MGKCGLWSLEQKEGRIDGKQRTVKVEWNIAAVLGTFHPNDGLTNLCYRATEPNLGGPEKQKNEIHKNRQIW